MPMSLHARIRAGADGRAHRCPWPALCAQGKPRTLNGARMCGLSALLGLANRRWQLAQRTSHRRRHVSDFSVWVKGPTWLNRP